MNLLIRSALMLGLAAMLGAAQGGGQGGAPQPGSRVEDLPPEVRALLPPGAILSGPPVSDGDSVYDAPRPVDAPLASGPQPLAADVVIASETMQLPPFHFRLAGPLTVGRPFNARHPAGTDVPRLVNNGVVRNCIRQQGWYVPPEDERGEIYPGLCLEDRDQDGRYETAILLPYHIDRAQERTVSITPVRLEPHPAAMEDDPAALRVRRRIRVTSVGTDSARIVLEQGVALWRQADITSYYSRPEDSVALPLRDGASASLGGVEFRLQRDGAGWRVATAGRFTPWLEVRDNGDLIMAGGMEFRRPPTRY